MTKIATLPQSWSELLARQPETGMGYHVVSVVLHDGRRIEDVAIVECRRITEVRGFPDIPFEPGDIANLKVTHQKWQFRY